MGKIVAKDASGRRVEVVSLSTQELFEDLQRKYFHSA